MFMKYMGPNRIVVGGVYYTSTQGNMTLSSFTLTPRVGDVLTVFAAVLDSNLTPLHVFNVIGFTETGGAFNDTRLWDMHADAIGNIYFSGSYSQDTLLSYFGDTIISDTYQEAFIIRCDTIGQTTLLKSCGTREWNTNYKFEDCAHSICSDNQGNIFFSVGGEGKYFEINGDTINSTTLFSNVSSADIFMVSLFPNGNTRWLKCFGTVGKDDVVYDTDVNSAGEVSICGVVSGSNSLFRFGPLSHFFRYSQYGFQSFVGKLDANGVPVWLSPIEVYYPSGPDVGAYATAIDDSGYVYSSGYFDAWAVFNGDTIRSLFYSSNYFSKYDLSGQTKFVKLGNIDTFYPYPIYMDENKGKFLITGQTFTNQLTFQQYGQCCSMEAYAVVYDAQGEVQWLRGAKSVNSSNPYFGMGCLNENGTAYVCGTGSGGTVEIAPLQIPISASAQYYVVKFSAAPSNGLSLSLSNNGNDTLLCGFTTPLVPTLNPAVGPRLTWWANNDTISNPNFVTTLNASPKLNSLYIATAFYNGCVVSDSIFLSVNPLPVDAGSYSQICSGTPLTLTGNTLQNASYSWLPTNLVSSANTSQTQFLGLQNAALFYTVSRGGCSATDTVNINVQPLPLSDFTFSNNLLSVSFLSTASNQDSLYWDFGDGSSFDYSTNPQHSYTQNGIYTACLHTFNSCGTDSVCKTINLSTVGITELKSELKILRSDWGYTVNSIKSIGNYNLTDAYGRILISGNANESNIDLRLEHLPRGIYILNQLNGATSIQIKLMW